MKQQNDEILAFLKGYPPVIGKIAQGLRAVISSAIPGVREELDRPARVIGYGLGPGYAGLICTIILSKKGVKLGVVYGAELADPQELLEGPGKRHRYIAFTKTLDLEKPGLPSLLAAAIAAWRHKNA